MSSKRLRIKRASIVPLEEYDCTRFIFLQVSRRYTSLSKKKDFIKEKGFESPNNFFQRAIVNKEWQDLCKAPSSVVKVMVREFCANLSEQEDMKVWVQVKWVPFDSETIHRFCNLPNANDEEYQGCWRDPTVLK